DCASPESYTLSLHDALPISSAYLTIRIFRHGFASIRFVYWVLMALIALHLVFGIIANQVQAGTIIIGGRMYLRTIPFFLLALAIDRKSTRLNSSHVKISYAV